jgi:hypothetical protein
MTEIDARDELAAGWLAAERREPFQQFTTIHWQRGYTDRKRSQVAADLGAAQYRSVLPTLEALAVICRALRQNGEGAVDLAQAIALRSLAGDDPVLELSFDPHAAAPTRAAA